MFHLMANLDDIADSTIHATMSELAGEPVASAYSHSLLHAWVLSTLPSLVSTHRLTQCLHPRHLAFSARQPFVVAFHDLVQALPTHVARTMIHCFASQWLNSVDWENQTYETWNFPKKSRSKGVHAEYERQSFEDRATLDLQIGTVFAQHPDYFYLSDWSKGLPKNIPFLMYLATTNHATRRAIQMALQTQNLDDWMSSESAVYNALSNVLPLAEWERIDWLPLQPNQGSKNQRLLQRFAPQTFQYLDTFLYTTSDWNDASQLRMDAQAAKQGPQHHALPTSIKLPDNIAPTT